jgi:hypothetical protein
MFAKKARSQYFTRDFQLGLGATVRAGNDNQPVRQTSQPRPSRRPGLFCRWQRTSAGQLECHWQTGKTEPDSCEEGISLLAQRCANGRPISLFCRLNVWSGRAGRLWEY